MKIRKALIALFAGSILLFATPTALTPVAANGPYPAAGTVFTFTAADVANGNEFAASGRDLILAYNSDVSSHNVTITSQADQFGRLGTITSEALPAGAYHLYGPLAKTGWANSSGQILLSADNAGVKFAILQIP